MTRPPVSTIADQIFFSTVHIEAYMDTGTTSTGTGFLVSYQNGDGTLPVLVTNKHVLQGAVAATFTMPGSANGQPMNTGTRITATDFNSTTWAGHPRHDVDVATMMFGPILNQMEADGAPAFFRCFAGEVLLTAQQAEELDSIENVTFVGYPNGLFDTASMLPIARRGQTATPIFNDYNGQPAFLIDASVFPGSSGSPVFIYDRGAYGTRDAGIQVGTRFHVAGVVASVHTRRVHGEVQLASNGIASFDDMIDLGIVYKSSAIQECVDVLFAQHGIRLESSPRAEDLA